MLWFDYVVIGIVVVSGLVGVWRGFFKEAVSLGTWIVAIWVALTFAEHLAPSFTRIDAPIVRLMLAGATLFVVVLLSGGLLNSLIGAIVKGSGLSGTDRMMGMVFGFARGVLIVAVSVVYAAGVMPLEDEGWWQESALVPHLTRVGNSIMALLPDDIARYLDSAANDLTASGR